MNLELLMGGDALDLVADDWRDLVESSGAATFFQTWEWHRAWWEAIGSARGDSEPVIGRLRSAGRVVGLVPLVLVEVDGRTVLRFLTAPIADYHDLVAEDDLPVDAIDAAAAALLDRLAPDAVELDEVRPQARLRGTVERLATELLVVEDSSRCPFVRLGAGLEPEASIAGHGQYARKRRRLEKCAGALDSDHLVEPADIGRCLDSYFRMHADQWRERADVAGSFEESENVHLFEALVRRAAPRGWLLFSRLRAGGAVIAQDFSFRHRDVLSTYRSTFERNMARHSPGHLLLRRIFDFAHRTGVQEVDLLRGEYPYKYLYADGERRNVRLRTRGSTIPLARSDGIVAISSLRPVSLGPRPGREELRR